MFAVVLIDENMRMRFGIAKTIKPNSTFRFLCWKQYAEKFC